MLACTAIPLALAAHPGRRRDRSRSPPGSRSARSTRSRRFRLKRFPVAASLCITGVRAIVVNLGVYWHFAGDISPPVWALCLFVLPFSFAIAVLKDVPDLEGDRRFAIRTFTVRMGAAARLRDRAGARSRSPTAG